MGSLYLQGNKSLAEYILTLKETASPQKPSEAADDEQVGDYDANQNINVVMNLVH